MLTGQSVLEMYGAKGVFANATLPPSENAKIRHYHTRKGREQTLRHYKISEFQLDRALKVNG